MKRYTILFCLFVFVMNAGLKAQYVLRSASGATLTVQNGAAININGGIVLDNGSVLSNAGTITITKPVADKADFIDSTTTAYNYGTGKFVFSGTGAQNINSINQFDRIDVDNAGLNFTSNVKSNNWYLKSGKINTGAFTAIATGTSANAIQADATNSNFTSSWFNGKLQRFITPATVNTYQFPVGDAAKVNLAEMDNLSLVPLTGVTAVTTSFGPKPGTDFGLNVVENGAAYTAVNNGGVWYLTPNANPVSGQYDVKLYFNGFTGLTDNSFGILRRDDGSVNASEWIVPLGSSLPANGTPGRTVTGGFARRNNISTFSQLGIGTSFGALPVQLLSFYAIKKDKTILLQWTTTSEINNSHFELYKGAQPASMQYLDRVAAGGPGNHNYDFTDFKPLKGLSFYQLKMVDKNNSFKLSETVKVNVETINSLAVYPNPVSGNMLLVEYNGGKLNQVKLITADGKQLLCKFLFQNSGQFKVSLPAGLAKGSYTLQLATDDGLRNTTLIIQ